MWGYGPQIAALTREIAVVRGRLAYLLDSDRRRRNQQGGEASTPITQPAHSGCGAPIGSVGPFFVVCTFVAGLFCGGLLTTGAICLGIWVGRLS